MRYYDGRCDEAKLIASLREAGCDVSDAASHTVRCCGKSVGFVRGHTVYFWSGTEKSHINEIVKKSPVALTERKHESAEAEKRRAGL